MLKNKVTSASYELVEGSIISGVGYIDRKREKLPAYCDGMVEVYFPDGFDHHEASKLGFSKEWNDTANSVLLENKLVEFTYEEFSELVAGGQHV